MPTTYCKHCKMTEHHHSVDHGGQGWMAPCGATPNGAHTLTTTPITVTTGFLPSPKHLARLAEDEEAVSPVLATLLLVAITIILAATLWGLVQALIPIINPPDYDQDASHQHTTNTNHTSTESGGSQSPPTKEETWSVEPLPGWECEEVPLGPRDFLCTRVTRS